jgi:hypothetical protein
MQTTRRSRLLAIAITFALATGIVGCGNGNDNKRTRERCEACDPAQIDHGCVDQCLRFCAPGEEDCAGRCTRECDRCKAELECRACTSDCTGTTARCAPIGETLTCDDGIF